jgi:hypothetical protein
VLLTRERFSVIKYYYEFFSLAAERFVRWRAQYLKRQITDCRNVNLRGGGVTSTAHMPNVIFLPFR